MSGIFYAIITFFINAFLLKVAVDVVRPADQVSRYGTAIGVAFSLNILGFVFGLIPFFGWLIYLVAWLVIVMAVYKLRVMQSLGVAILQVIFKMVAAVVLSLIGANSMGLTF